jgi:TonB family protein
LIVVVHLDLTDLAPSTPHLPRRRLAALTHLGASLGVHLALIAIASLIRTTAAPVVEPRVTPPTEEQRVRIVFLAPQVPSIGGGGGGGGNRRTEPIRRAQGVGSDASTLRIRKPSPVSPVASVVPAVEELPSIVLDARPLASGFFDQIGLPAGGVLSSPSTGPGSGGGVGTGTGTGIGSGQGPGLGRGSGGGTGGGVYHVGSGVSAPIVIKQVRPKYTGEALRDKIQGTVVLEAVVMADGCASQFRVVKSLDPGGLDEEAVAAVKQWRFEPGRLGGTPVDVLVLIMLDFTIR